jgi:hypothetical protein
MSAAEKFKEHLASCPKCVQDSPGKWNYCGAGAALLAAIPPDEHEVDEALFGEDE